MQAHALGEVNILGTVLLRVYSGTLLPIFIEIGSYLTDKEQKFFWHSFFLRRGVYTVITGLLLKPVHTVAEKCDSRRISPLSRRFRRQSHFSVTVWTGL